MITVFIQYSDDGEGLNIGLDFRKYLKEHNLDPFLAGQNSPDINYGEANFWTLIEQKLISSNVIVAICTDGYEASEGVIRELDIRDQKANHIPIIPFLKNTCQLPRKLEGIWRLQFDPLNYQECFCELTLAIYREYNRKIGYLINNVYRASNVTRIKELYPLGEL